ncbi:hypothetical protein Holit_02274 [Hollandina sp. SP2]
MFAPFPLYLSKTASCGAKNRLPVTTSPSSVTTSGAHGHKGKARIPRIHVRLTWAAKPPKQYTDWLPTTCDGQLATAQCKAAFGALTAKMRDFKKGYFLTLPNAGYRTLGLNPRVTMIYLAGQAIPPIKAAGYGIPSLLQTKRLPPTPMNSAGLSLPNGKKR